MIGHVIALAHFVTPRTLAAYQASVDGQSILQLYSVQGLYGMPSLSRQRLTHNLGLEVVDLAGSAWNNEPWVTVRFRVRMDADYGISPASQGSNNTDYFVPGLRSSPLDILYAYVEGGGWLRNSVGFRLGRQLFFDELGWWALDGARVAFSPGRLFELAGYAGFEQRGGLPLMSTGRYEAGGVFRGNRDGMGASEWPSYLQSTSLAPAVGASLVLLAVPRLRARLDYRRVWQRDQVVTSPFLDTNGNLATTSVSRVSTERAGLGLGYDFGAGAGADGAAVYDLYRSKLVEHRAAMQARLAAPITLSLNYQYRLPTYDADSIFNWFGAVGSTVTRVRVGIDLRRDWNLGATAGIRWYGAPLASATSGGQLHGAERDGLGSIDSTWHSPELMLRVAQTAEMGDAGDRWVGDAMVTYRVNGGTVAPSAIVSMARWRDRLRSDFNSTVFTYVLGCRFSPTGAPRFGLDWEHSMSDATQQRFRLVGTVDVRWP
jgi:hypothetical protein